ncbi:MAG: GreA/GreB family elongation factor [Bacteroidetes bacterium]|nr:GreA/GreB family elongation factor [Bacteroidota bacterium]
MSTDNTIILLKEDHQLLTKSLEQDANFAVLNEEDKKAIKDKLTNAQQVSADDFPNTVSRLYDKITIRNIKDRINIQYQIVPPAERDHWNGKISAISPLGIALMGVTKGQNIVTHTRNRKQYYAVMEVINAMYI